jgi:hypothetical protein
MDRHIERFLEMMAAERGALRNTLLSYQADLDDFAAFAGARRCAPAGCDQRGEGGILRVAAGLAPGVHPVAGAGDRARRRQVVRHPGPALASRPGPRVAPRLCGNPPVPSMSSKSGRFCIGQNHDLCPESGEFRRLQAVRTVE